MNEKPGQSKRKANQKRMTDKPNPWPRHAAEDRNRCAELAQDADEKLSRAIAQCNDAEILRLLSATQDDVVRILRFMEKHGAATRPI